MRAFVLFLGFLIGIGCGNGKNPVRTGVGKVVDEHQIATVSEDSLSKELALQVRSVREASAGQVAASSSFGYLEADVEYNVTKNDLIVLIIAREGYFTSQDIVRVYYDDGNEESYLGWLRTKTGEQWAGMSIHFKHNRFSTHDRIRIVVRVERYGGMVTSSRTDRFRIHEGVNQDGTDPETVDQLTRSDEGADQRYQRISKHSWERDLDLFDGHITGRLKNTIRQAMHHTNRSISIDAMLLSELGVLQTSVVP